MERIDTVVIGAGVMGLAGARELALAGHEVVIVEVDDHLDVARLLGDRQDIVAILGDAP